MSFLDGYNFGSRAPGPAERDRCDEGGESATICVKELMDLGSVRGRGSDSAPPSGGDRCGGGGDGTTICVRELMDLSGIRRGLALGSGPAEQSTQGPTGQAQASAPGPAPGHGPAAPSVPPQSPSHSQLKMASKRPTVDIPGRREAPEVTLGAGERAKEDDAGTRVGRQGGEEKSAPRAEDATPKSTNSPASTYSPASTSSAAGGHRSLRRELSRKESRVARTGSAFRYKKSETEACRRLDDMRAAFAVLTSPEFLSRAGEDDEVVRALHRMPVEILALAVAEGTAEPCVVEASLQEVQDLVDTEGVRAVDLCGKTVTGRQGKVLQVRRPGVTLRNGRLDVRGGAVRLWYRSGRGEDAWAGLVVRGEGCALEGIELTGVRESGYGVAIDNVGACRMVDCRFWRMGETGGWVVGEQSDVRMTRCTFSENGGYGLLVSDGGTLELTEGVVERNYGMGLVVSGDGTAVEVSGSRLVGNKSHGVFVRDGGRCVLRGTAVCGNGKNGVMAYMSGSSIYAKECDVSENELHGAVADDEATVLLEGATNDLGGNKRGRTMEEYGGKITEGDAATLADAADVSG